ncbi:hypothetical protein P4E94_01580 [Pontiellaceae bacterium B12219]|nr:hypothetical protein [Pontiellaceae bacterium B12219]
MIILLPLILQAEGPYELDFADAQGDVKAWFEAKGWRFQGKILKMNPRFEGGALVLETLDSDSGAFIYEFEDGSYVNNANYILIDWGVEQYPEGADWEGPIDKSRNTRDAIDVIISFGTEKISSGKLLIPNMPYFIGLFPGDGETAGKAYYGNYWQKGGRYFCISGSGTLEPIQTRFALSETFQKTFGKPAPPVTGIAIEVDAKDTKRINGRHTKAYIRKISIVEM